MSPTASRPRLKLKHIAVIALAVVVMSAIFIPFQHVEAFSLGINIPSSVTESSAGADFDINLDVKPGELISFQTITVLLDGGQSTQKLCTFDNSGHVVGGSCDII